MPYGTIKVDNITFTNGGSDTTITVSGLAASTTGDLTVTGTISGAVVRATTVSGVTVTGTTIQGASGTFTSITGGIATITSGVFALGSAAAPSISFSSDPNTGIYSPGADQVAISTNGSGRLFVTSAGLVGIGEATPVAKFHVRTDNAGSGSTPLLIQNRSVSANTAVGISFAPNTSDTADRSAIIYGVNSSGGSGNGTDLTFHTNANGSAPTEKVRITSAGLVGIGTSAPATNLDIVVGSGTATQKLGSSSVTGGSYLNLHGASASKTWFIGANYNFAGVLEFTQSTANGGTTPSSTPAMVLSATGNVGVGTSSPNKLLHLAGTEGEVGAYQLELEGRFNGYGAGITFSSRTSSGGTLVPMAKITADGEDVWNTTASTQDASLRFYTTLNGTLSEKLRITSTGLVGVGTSLPSNTAGFSQQLELAGSLPCISINQNNAGYTTRKYSLGVDSIGAFGVWDNTASAYRMYVNSSGSVGIGTTSPGELLSVNGNVSITSTNRIKTTDSGGNLTIQGGGTFPGGHIILNGGNGSDNIIFNRSGASASTVETARIDSSGRLLVGTSSSRQVNASIAALQFQLEGTTYQSASMSLVTNQNNTDGSYIVLGKSRGATLNSSTIVNSGDLLGSLWFCGADGNTMPRSAAIEAFVDGTPGASDMPGRIVLSTTADGASSPTERMRINNGGSVLINATANNAQLVVNSNIPAHPAQRCALFAGTATGDVTMEAVGIAKFDNNSTTSQIFQRFYINNGANGCGQINANGSGAAAFGSFSDARLKENIVDLPTQLNKIKNLRPVEFDYKDGSGHQIGFIAQEMQNVYPEAISQGKDEMLMITGWGKTEAYLVKALQEAIAKIETLEAKVAALEAQ